MDWLPPAEYHLSHRLPDGRGAYTFCMCPGGKVVNASSEPGRLCVNGMSPYRRNSENANAAILVDVRPEDYAMTHGRLTISGAGRRKAFQLEAAIPCAAHYYDFAGCSLTRLGNASYVAGRTPGDLVGA